MNTILTIDTSQFLRRSQLAGLLESVCQELELSPTQQALATERYEAIGRWLGDASDPALRSSTIYPQGSIALQTTVKPIGREEYDLDLVCFVLGLTPVTEPAQLKRLVGLRLASHGSYKQMLEEKPRCWRINYANEFHLDITPSIANPACTAGGELVPDRTLREWKPTNPKGYRRWFEERAALQPSIQLDRPEFRAARAEIEALPAPTRFKGVLRRCVQLCKRHRDVFFSSRTPELAPISIILTTLAARSYTACVARSSYETELDLLVDVVRQMPAYIERATVAEREYYFVWNETTTGENFAEKWNLDQRLADAFYAWHAQATLDLERATVAAGLDELRRLLGAGFGDRVATHAIATLTQNVGRARAAGNLSVTRAAGLVSSPTGTRVQRNTFFGSQKE